MPEWEQYEYLGYDYRRQSMIDAMLEPIVKKISEEKPIDVASYYMLMLAKYGG